MKSIEHVQARQAAVKQDAETKMSRLDVPLRTEVTVRRAKEITSTYIQPGHDNGMALLYVAPLRRPIISVDVQDRPWE